MRILGLLIASLLVTACTPAVRYGKVAHAQIAAGTACNPDGTTDQATADQPYFAVTSRLPDCTKPGRVSLTSHRSDQLRYFRFDAPAPKAKFIPIALQSEGVWWQALEQAANKGKGRVLIYVHGYRETPFTVGHDTAQIARLSGFEGAVIQYGWSSQGKLFSYLVDETNMEINRPDFSVFLSRLASKSWAKDIVIVSHSLGVRLVLPAIDKVDQQLGAAQNPIRNLVLASPDIDLQAFEAEAAAGLLGPAQVDAGRHVTVYASLADRALAISRHLHGYPRMGSPYCFDAIEGARLKQAGLPVRCYVRPFEANSKQGLTLIDTTDVRHRRTAHSDYLLSAPGCRDFASAVAGGRGESGERRATHLAHVFTLPRQSKDQQKQELLTCKLK